MGLFDFFKKKEPVQVKEEDSTNILSVLPTGRETEPTTASYHEALKEQFLGLPEKAPFYLLDDIRGLIDTNPTVGFAVHNMVNYTNSGHRIVADNPAVAEKINNLAKKVNKNGGGMDGLVNVWAFQAYYAGAFAFEIVLNNSLTDVEDIVPVDVRTIRFKLENGKHVPYQIRLDGKAYKLNEHTFFYVRVFQVDDNPYGNPTLKTAILPSIMHNNMTKSLQKALEKNSIFGQAIIKMLTEKMKPLKGESEEDRAVRIAKVMNQVKNNYNNKKFDEPLVINDAMEVSIESGAATNLNNSGYIDYVNSLLANGTKMESIFLNDSKRDLQAFGTVQLEIQVRNINFVQNMIRRSMEDAYRLALLVWGLQKEEFKVEFNENRSIDMFKEAEAEVMATNRYRTLFEHGIISADQWAAKEGFHEGAYGEPLIELRSEGKGGAVNDNSSQEQKD